MKSVNLILIATALVCIFVLFLLYDYLTNSSQPMKIDSVAYGKMYVRNIGESPIDTSHLYVYVDDVSISIKSSSKIIEPSTRATLTFTSAPSCKEDICKLEISGAGMGRAQIPFSKLICLRDSDCSQGETCKAGVCTN